PDVVGDAPVGGVAVGADPGGACQAAAQELSRGAIHDEREGDAVALELPGGEARALQQGASLRGVHALELALLPGGADDAQGGAVAAGGQRARVAVGEE